MQCLTGAFSINATSGAVTVSGILDRESVRQYDLTVEGIDGGNPSLTGTAALIISIIDANDNSPQFDRSFYTAEIVEGKHELVRCCSCQRFTAHHNIVQM